MSLIENGCLSDFTYRDIVEGCEGLLRKLTEE